MTLMKVICTDKANRRPMSSAAATKKIKLHGAQPPGSPLCADFVHNGVEVPSAATEESWQADRVSNDSHLERRGHGEKINQAGLTAEGAEYAEECAGNLAQRTGNGVLAEEILWRED